MMKKAILLLWCLILFSAVAYANEVGDSIPEPEFINFVYHFDKTNNKLVDLEKANAEMKMKMKVMGGGSQAYEIGGSKSPVRLDRAQHSFMITISGGMAAADPTNTLTLYKLESKKGRREAVMAQYGGLSGQNSTVELRFKKIREGTYEIVVAGILEMGEYGFMSMTGMNQSGMVTFFAFGID